MVHKFINTVQGRAKLVAVLTEDAHGRWDDHWRTADGYWVVHSGDRHYVYEVI
jgi:hypothetical protein